MRDTRHGLLALVGLTILLAATGCAPQAYQEIVYIGAPPPRPDESWPSPRPLPPELPPTQADPSPEPVRHTPIDRDGDTGTATKVQEDRGTTVTETPRPKPPRTEQRSDPPANDARDGQREATPVRTRTR